MAYTLFESGRTGPSQNIGGSSDYHIDSKFSTSLGAEKARRMFEEKVKRYNSLGRNVEFSNEGVAGAIYDMSLADEKRALLFDKAQRAHAARDGWYALDYYAPKQGFDRHHESAEGAPIFAIGLNDGRRETGVGGDYGFHSLMYDNSGQLIAKVGHGDDRFPSSTKEIALQPASSQASVPLDYSDMSAAQLNSEYDKMRMAGDAFKARGEGMKMHKAFFNKR